MKEKDRLFFTHSLLDWHDRVNNRQMPWKTEQDPYRIWLSEIILQQTRVEQGTPYYLRFTEEFPTVFDLANATGDEIMKLWQGLGYYSRPRNLHKAAKKIVREYDGQFPNSYSEIIDLPGVGPYTAAAIMSFAFKKPYPVIDGNVYRVLSRFSGSAIPVDSSRGKQKFREMADSLMAKEAPAEYNQSIMDFGAQVCKPRQPECEKCLLNVRCVAFKMNSQSHLPVKKKRLIRKNRYFNFLILKNNGQFWVQKRRKNDIWRNLYQFPLIETETLLPVEQLMGSSDLEEIMGSQPVELKEVSPTYRQTLTHQHIFARFIYLDHAEGPGKDYLPVNKKILNNLAFPKVIACFIKDKILYLSLQ